MKENVDFGCVGWKLDQLHKMYLDVGIQHAAAISMVVSNDPLVSSGKELVFEPNKVCAISAPEARKLAGLASLSCFRYSRRCM